MGQFSKLQYLGIKLGYWQKFPKLHTQSLGEIELILLHGQRFQIYRPILKIAVFGHETKVPQFAHTFSYYPRRGEIELIFTSRAAVSEIWANFQNCHIWA